MKGSLQGDFSRLRFDRRKHYSAVHMQQGRVQLDSDWNEQVEILNHRLRTEAIDVIGHHGAPAQNAGFGIEAEWGLEVGAEHGIVTIGGKHGCSWPTSGRTQSGAEEAFTLELRALPQGPGVLYSRWIATDGRLEHADSLSLEADGSLKLLRPGQPDLLSDRLHLGDSPTWFAVTCGSEDTTLYVAGEPVAQIRGGIPAATLEHNTLLLASGYGSNRPEQQLEGLLFEVRLWGRQLPAELLRLELDPALEALPSLLGHWRFSDGQGAVVIDESGHHHDARVRRSSDPRRRPYLSISAGRYYAEGLLCENEKEVGLDRQPDYPGANQPRFAGDTEVELQLIYLEAWEREISPIEDPDLREVALDGLTTTTRTRVVAQVKTLSIGLPEQDRHDLTQIPEWHRLVHGKRRQGRLRARFQPRPSSALDNLLYRVEIHEGAVSAEARIGEHPGQLRLSDWHPSWAAGQAVELEDNAGATRRLQVRRVDPDQKILELDGDAPVEDLERLTIERLATFKWSSSNGARSFPVARLASKAATLQASFEGSLQELRPGTWMELIDDPSTLRGEPWPLVQVAHVDTMRREILFTASLPEELVGAEVAAHEQTHLSLRAWDQGSSGQELLPNGLLLAEPGRWVELEEGIQVLFEAELGYRGSDYWVIPARTASQNVEWPRDADGEPVAMAPHGIQRAYAPLALLTCDRDSWRLDDLRRTFQPFSHGAVSKAGDVVEGGLEIRENLTVHGELRVPGDSHLGKIYGQLAGRGMVEGPQLAAGAVSSDKLAHDVGVVPDGYSILGPTRHSPPGYVCTDSSLTVLIENTAWNPLGVLPEEADGPFRCAELGGDVFVLLESGDLWRYDLKGKALHRCQDLPLRKRRFGFSSLGDKLYVVGGLDAVNQLCPRALAYDPTHDSWEEVEPLPTARCDLALVSYGEGLHAFGGLRRAWFGRVVTRRHEVYDPTTDTWERKRSLPRACCGLAAASVSMAIHVVGGEHRWLLGRWGRQQTARHLLYSPTSDQWLGERSPLPVPRRDLALVEDFGRLYAIGGQGPWERIEDGWSRVALRYDPSIDNWSAIAPLSEPILGPGATASDGKLFVAGTRNTSDRHLLEECEVAQRFYLHRRDWQLVETRSGTREDDTQPVSPSDDELFP